ncbi:MAG: DUF3857 domain-containing protein [Bacteroidota bacterium]
MRHLINFFCSFFLLLSFLPAQDLPEIRFGQIPLPDIQMTSYAADTTAEAVVLYDGIDISIIQGARSYELSRREHRRVKILKASAFERANVQLSYRRGDENINDLEASIHLPNGETIELRNRDFIRENGQNEVSSVKFTFPQVTEGAIIEYRYRYTSKYLTQLPRYYFQETIPVRMAEFKADLRANFSYLSLSNAFEQMCINEERQVKGDVNPSYGNSNGVTSIIYHYAMCDIPAFQLEPYVNNLRDYVPHVQLQLSHYYNQGFGWDEVLGSWEGTVETLLDDPDVGLRFRRDNQFRNIKEDVGPLIGETEKEQAQYALDQVNAHMDWNGKYRISSDESAKDSWEATVGNSAAINIIMLGLLRASGIKAEPLLVGLRDDGRPIQQFPVIRQFSHLMVLATLDGEPTIIDANGSAGIIGLPRVQALNGAAWVLSADDQRWIPVESGMMPQIHRAEVELAADGSATINTQSMCRGYYRFAAQSDLADEGTEPEGPILDYYLDKYPTTEFIDRQVAPVEAASDPVQIELQVEASIAEAVGDYLYLRPVLMDFLSTELVETDKRQFPIDFAFPWRKVITAEIQLPAGYVLDEKPEDSRIQSPDGGIRTHLYLQYKSEENSLAINFSVRVGKAIFGPQEYEILREVFQQVIELQESVVVLRKITD